jgi:hypothetical protein
LTIRKQEKSRNEIPKLEKVLASEEVREEGKITSQEERQEEEKIIDFCLV